MKDSERYLEYAEECERLAVKVPALAVMYKSIALSWRKLAKDAERAEEFWHEGTRTRRGQHH